jgi:hypothetical protein
LIIDRARVREFLSQPSESLNVEIKRWIDPDQDAGVATIVKAVFALRNRNGGFFVLGFDNETLEPDDANRPIDPHKSFHIDKVQGIISRFASEPFEINVVLEQVKGKEHVIIIVPEGVTTPVSIKRNLISAERTLLALGDVYFRTLNANGTPSTARARPEDWQTIVDICFDNREADIGRFLRRHLAGQGAEAIAAALTQATEGRDPSVHPALQLLKEGEHRYRAALAKRKFNKDEERVVEAATWSVALVCVPPRKEAITDQQFLNTIGSSNPNYTGWPIWRDIRFVHDRAARVGIIDGAWEMLCISPEGYLSPPRLEFSRLDAKGEFYSLRNLQDDVSKDVAPGQYLDPLLVLRRVSEALAVGIALVRALEWGPRTQLAFAFRWTKLRGRRLTPWVDPFATIGGGMANDNDINTFVAFDLETSPTAVAPLVVRATERLFALFDGARIPSNAVEEVVRLVLERR